MTQARIVCTACKTPLTGGADTFGEVQLPMCQECWFALSDEPLTGDVPMSADWKVPQYPHGGWFAVGERRP